MRNYNFRKKAKRKEQRKRKEIYNRNYFPTMPQAKLDKDNKEFFLQGAPDGAKKVVKEMAKKAARRSEDIPSGSGYKKTFDLWWNWF